MSPQAQTAARQQPAPKVEQPQPTTPKQPRSRSESVAGPEGDVLRFVTVFRRDGATTFVIHTTKDAKGKRLNVRGATERHPNAAAAEVAVERLVAAALKLGWTRREGGRRGFVARPDAFDAAHLPAAGRTPSKKR